ncbi:MAG: AAA family ATPase, partial [Gammaproteobacteria bacterium]
NVAAEVLKRNARVYYFDRDGSMRDISKLDPGSDDARESGWGGLSEFSGRVNETVAWVVSEK